MSDAPDAPDAPDAHVSLSLSRSAGTRVSVVHATPKSFLNAKHNVNYLAWV